MKERSLLSQLKAIYKGTIERDDFGRRVALPSEIRAAIDPGFPGDLNTFLPTDADISLKVDERKTIKPSNKRGNKRR